jgi:MoxR-like ATPase
MAAPNLATFDAIKPAFDELRAAVGTVIVGQEPVVEAVLRGLLCRGHVLLVGVPGLAKTLLVRTVAAAAGLQFGRIQFTPDLMPADILGSELIQTDPASGERIMRFVPGPVFCEMLLADEVNRTPPRTQAALLEAMAEHQVTVAGQTRSLGEPFVVVATQNPIEQEGTYPLPEAQLDRFLMSVSLSYPSAAQELDIAAGLVRVREAAAAVQPVLDAERLRGFSAAVDRMPVSREVADLAVRLVRATRPAEEAELAAARDAAAAGGASPAEAAAGGEATPAALRAWVRKYVAWGAGPRASQALVQVGKAAAALAGEPAATQEHVRAVAIDVLRHRVLVNFQAASDGLDADAVVRHVLDAV